MSFRLHAVLSSMMKSCAVLLCAVQDVNHPFVQRIQFYMLPLISGLVALVVI